MINLKGGCVKYEYFRSCAGEWERPENLEGLFRRLRKFYIVIVSHRLVRVVNENIRRLRNWYTSAQCW
jgi:hypothetical protein